MNEYNNCSNAFWGEPDVELQFCEDKYQTKYIAEYYNSISAISYIFVGFLLYLYNKKKEGIVVIILGIGTFIMHATLRYYGQWIDEISMIIVESISIKKQKKIKYHNIYLCLIISLYFYFQSALYFVTIFFILLLYIGYLTKKKLKNGNKKIIIYTFLMCVSFTCWLFDQFLCGMVSNVNFHALWHVGTSLAIFSGFMSI